MSLNEWIALGAGFLFLGSLVVVLWKMVRHN